ncbi:hypothetical protein RHMOL_Rhmol04G0181500 [Rhododendron molle]|uniref:Uncharacterized protein n=1 Tax=Rhododendron molle TaxID=49168 RepID=A0ACC0P480_RHOML|nr:hypothetical protein RHMOL_Rhmol04G0181500 [Rhododendron molle]
MPAVTCAKAKAQHEETCLFRWVARLKQFYARKKGPKKPRHGKPIACHQARQGIAQGMPRPSAAKARQADFKSPGKARQCITHGMTRPRAQGMTHGMPKQGVAKARLSRQSHNKGWRQGPT